MILLEHKTEDCYNDLSSYYHLIFDNWNTYLENEAKIIASLLPPLNSCGSILDCSCGIGTQLIGLKQLGYDIDGSDLSNKEVNRALKEAKKRNLTIDIRVDDMRTLKRALLNHYSVVLVVGNSIPHLSNENEIVKAFIAMKERLISGGIILVGVRDYEQILSSKPKITEPLFFHDESGQRIVHQVWDWQDERRYTFHLYITQKIKRDWVTHHFVGHYTAITPKEIESLMGKAGLTQTSILSPDETGLCQIIIRGVKDPLCQESCVIPASV